MTSKDHASHRSPQKGYCQKCGCPLPDDAKEGFGETLCLDCYLFYRDLRK